MATRARNTAAEFFDAAQKVLDEKDRKDKQLAAALRATRAANRRAEQERKQKLHAAFADYRKTLQPLLEAIEALPARKGDKFMVRLHKNIFKDSRTGEESRGLSLWIAYAKPLVSPEDRAATKPGALPMPAKGVSDTLDAYPATNGRTILAVKIEHKAGVGETIFGGTAHGYFDQLKTIEDIPAYIGAWMASAAPERLNDLKKALGRKPSKPRLPQP